MPELTAEQVATYESAMKLLRDMESDPKARPHLAKAIKTVKPDVVTPEDEAERLAQPFMERLNEAVKAVEGHVDALKKSQDEAAEKAALAKLENSFVALRSRGYTDEGIEAVKKLMLDRSIGDPDAAAALFEKQNPPKNETASFTPDSWNFQVEDGSTRDVKGLFADPDRWADTEAAQVLNEIRMGQNA